MKNFTKNIIVLISLLTFYSQNLYSQNLGLGQAFAVGYPVSASEFGGLTINTYTVDLYVCLESENDVLLSVYNYNDINIGATYFQSLTSSGWQPTNLGYLFDTEASRLADSFVSIGGFAVGDGSPPSQGPGAGEGTSLDPNFGGNNVVGPPPYAGWYNANPASLMGQSVYMPTFNTNAVFIGRFSVLGSDFFDLTGTDFSIVYKPGFDADAQLLDVTVVTQFNGYDPFIDEWIVAAYGCMDEAALNYNTDATYDDGSCEYVDGSGCTDETAFNYDPEATVDDGSCEAIVDGCTDASAFNYNQLANNDDGSCQPVYNGCTDETAYNYNVDANTNDGSCVAVVNGCIDATAFNYDVGANTDDGSCIAVVNGCTDATAFNYNAGANTDDGSCVAIVNGCTDATAFNYSTDANTDDGSCVPVVNGCTDATAFNYSTDANTDDGSCMSWEEVVSNLQADAELAAIELAAAQTAAADAANAAATELASVQNELMIAQDEAAFLYDIWMQAQADAAIAADAAATELASVQNELTMAQYDAMFWQDEAALSQDEAMMNYDMWMQAQADAELAATELAAAQTAAEQAYAEGVASVEMPECEEVVTQNIPLDLPQGWSMFGYTCLESLDVISAFSGVSDNIEIVKDEWGLAYLPDWGFSAFDNLEFGEGYQIKMLEGVTDFQFCTTIAGGASQDELDAAIAEVHAMYEGWCESDIDNDGICDVDEVTGCMDASSCNYVSEAEFDDGSCDYVSCLDECGVINGDNSSCTDACGVINGDNSTCVDECGVINGDNSTCLDCAGVVNGTSEDLGCGCGNPAAQEGYDCDGNIVEYVVGMEAEGGIVFYVDETGQHGLVAAMEDLDGTFEWGCFLTELSGADGNALGTGYQNTLDIVMGCPETPIAASEALNYESDGYSDWFLPSWYELQEMYNTIGQGGPNGNIGNFANSMYWSSTEWSYSTARVVFFNDGWFIYENRTYPNLVRVIRAF